jgi:sRNA-binding protein
MLSSQTLTLKKSLRVEKQTQMEQISGQMSPAQDKIQHQRKAMDWLMQAFPQCFNLKAQVMGWYTRRFLYHKSFETATHRIDLDGKEAGEITETEKEYARERVNAIKKLRKARTGTKGDFSQKG